MPQKRMRRLIRYQNVLREALPVEADIDLPEDRREYRWCMLD